MRTAAFPLLFCVTSAILPRSLSAQQSTEFAVDIALAIGSGTSGGESYRDQLRGGVRLAAGVRKWKSSRIGFFGELAMEEIASVKGDAFRICNPDGPCHYPFPQFSGPSITAGVINRSPDRRVEMRLGGGAGTYLVDGARLGAVVATADLTSFAWKRVGILGGVRAVVVPHYRERGHLAVPMLTGGIRVR
jgi:hypothetical protein